MTEYPLDGYLHTRRSERVMLRRDKYNLRPLVESVGWVLAGATLGSVAVVLGAWGLINLTEPPAAAKSVVAMSYQTPVAPSSPTSPR